MTDNEPAGDPADGFEQPSPDVPDGLPDGTADAAFSVDAPGALPAGVPPRGAFVLVFVAVVLAGLFGAVIGYGLTDISADGSSTAVVAVGTLVGAVGAALGVGVVATLMLRAMSEWNTTKRRPR